MAQLLENSLSTGARTALSARPDDRRSGVRTKLSALRCRSPWFRRVTLCAWVLMSAASIFAANFTATLDRDTVAAGESATLTLSYEGGQPANFTAVPPVEGLQISESGTSQSFVMVNGRTTATISRTVLVTPQRPGEYVIPSLTAVIDGQTFRSQPLKLTAVKPGSTAQTSSGEQLAMLKLFLPKKQFYVGEVFPVQLQIFVREGVMNAESILRALEGFGGAPLRAEGFSIIKAAAAERRRAQIGNAIYNIGTLVIAVSPVKPGALTIDSINANLTLQLPVNNRPGDMFGFFRQYQEHRISLAAETENVTVLPLPKENAPPTFGGAVGTFTLDVTASPTNVAVGDPVTVRVQVSGRGGFDAMQWPEQPAWRDFKTYTPTVKLDTTDALGIQGTKTFEQAAVPQNTSIRELPPVSFSFFDPDKGSYQTLTHPAIPLLVRPGGSAIVPAAASNGEAQKSQEAQDIITIRQRPGTIAQITPPLIAQPWFLGLQAVPAIAFIAAVAWRKRRESFANNPRLRRQRHVSIVIRDGLNDLRRQAAENNSDGFFATLFRLLQEQLGERLEVPASAITEAVIEERLRPRGVGAELPASLHELFQLCNLARYAPMKTSQELAALIPKIETTLRQLKNLSLR